MSLKIPRVYAQIVMSDQNTEKTSWFLNWQDTYKDKKTTKQ